MSYRDVSEAIALCDSNAAMPAENREAPVDVVERAIDKQQLDVTNAPIDLNHEMPENIVLLYMRKISWLPDDTKRAELCEVVLKLIARGCKMSDDCLRYAINRKLSKVAISMITHGCKANRFQLYDAIEEDLPDV